MHYVATDSVFQPPIVMISSTAVPASFLLGEPPTRKKCIVKWLGSAAARRWAYKAVVIRAAESGRLPRPPPAVTTGNRCPAVKSHPIRCAAEMYAVTAWNAQTAGQSRSASTTTASLEALSVLSKLKVEDQTPGLGAYDLRPQCKRKLVAPTQ